MIYATGHIYPNTDLDSIASSMLVPKYIKKKYNLDAMPINLDERNKYQLQVIKKIGFNFPKKFKINKDDKFILVDHNSVDSSIARKGYKNELFGIIDHHRFSEKIKANKFKIYKNWGACATILYYLYKKEKIPITKKEAKLFYFAIITDTLNLAIDVTKKQDIFAISELKKKFPCLPNGDKVLFDSFELDTKTIKQKIFEDMKIFVVNGFSILLANIKTNGESINIDLSNKLLKQNFDLKLLMILDIKNKTTDMYYSGILSKYFKNCKKNKLLSRKKHITKIRNKLSMLNLSLRKSNE